MTTPISHHITAKTELEQRQASWSELFFDLGFVAIIAQLTYMIIDGPKDLVAVLTFILLSYITFWAWGRQTIIKNILPKEDTVTRMMIIAQTFCALIASIFVSTAIGSGAVGFALGIFGVKIILIGSIYYGYKLSPEHRPDDHSVNYAFFVSALLWFVSIFLPLFGAVMLWIIAQVIEAAAPYITTKNTDVIKLNKFHLPERLGLFVMLVIGESLIVIGLINKLALEKFDAITIISFLLVFSIMASLWWIYFNINDVYLKGKRFPAVGRVLEFHNLLVIGIMLLAVGTQQVIKAPMAEVIGLGSFILWGGIAIFASIIGIRVIFHKDIFHAGRLLTVSLIVMGASLFMTLPIVWYLAIVTAVFFIVSARVIVDQGKFLENIKF